MKLLPLSDLHFEFGRLVPEHFVRDLPDADVCVLAGDIYPHRYLAQSERVLGPFCERYKDVVYVPGNHEYYNSSPQGVSQILEKVCEHRPNLHWLRENARTVQGQPFYGGTMWFAKRSDDWKYVGLMNDFRLIKDCLPWAYYQNQAFMQGFQENVKAEHVVVSHHLPSFQSVPERYRADGMNSLNRFFVHTMDHHLFGTNPKLWIHGHTHTPADYVLEKTRVFCNPRGYPRENMSWEPEIVEI